MTRVQARYQPPRHVKRPFRETGCVSLPPLACFPVVIGSAAVFDAGVMSWSGTASLKQEPGGPFLDIERMCGPLPFL